MRPARPRLGCLQLCVAELSRDWQAVWRAVHLGGGESQRGGLAYECMVGSLGGALLELEQVGVAQKSTALQVEGTELIIQ